MNQSSPMHILQSRRSVRAYAADRQLDNALRNKIKAAATMINTHTYGLRLIPVFHSPEPFASLRHSYGMFSGVEHYIVCIIDTASPHVEERAGYCAEDLVIRLTALGLATCFVGVTFARSRISEPMHAGEKILFVIPFGYPAQTGKQTLKQKIMAKFTKPARSADAYYDAAASSLTLQQAREAYPRLDTALQAIACAPSAMAKRPVRIYTDAQRKLTIKVPDMKGYNPIDLGIAKYNIQYATEGVLTFAPGSPATLE